MTRSVRLAARQAVLEQRSFWRSAEYALFTFVFPLMILLLIGAANVGSYLPGSHVKNTTVFVPSILAFGVIVAAYVNLGSKVAVLRHDGVLKRIKTTPLPSAAYLGGLLASTVLTAIFITAGTGLIGWLAFGASPRPGGLRPWPPGWSWASCASPRWAWPSARSSPARNPPGRSPTPPSCPSRSSPASSIPPSAACRVWMERMVDAFPVKALAQVLQGAYTIRPFPAWDLVNLGLWTAAGACFVAWRFRWHS